jgi:hypothetical protein
MSLRNSFFVICLIILVFCLTIGYWIIGQRIGAVISILMGPAWLFARKYPASQLPLVCLLASVGLAAIGALTGAPPLWMIFGSTVALAVWDLLLLISALGNNASGEPIRRYQNEHIRSLSLALGFGLCAALLGHSINIQIPFIVSLFLVAFILFSLDRIWGYIKKTGKM